MNQNSNAGEAFEAKGAGGALGYWGFVDWFELIAEL